MTIWNGLTSDGAVVPIQVDDQGRVIAVGSGPDSPLVTDGDHLRPSDPDLGLGTKNIDLDASGIAKFGDLNNSPISGAGVGIEMGNGGINLCAGDSTNILTGYLLGNASRTVAITSSGSGIFKYLEGTFLNVYTGKNNDPNIARFTGGQGGKGLTIGTYSAAGNDGGVTLTAPFQLDCVASSGGVRLNAGGTSWVGISDERAKTNLQPITDGLNKVSSLRAVTGRYLKDDKDISRSFLIAQDVLKVLPEAVTLDKEKEDEYRLSYTEVIPLLVSALHDAKDRIEELEAKVAALES